MDGLVANAGFRTMAGIDLYGSGQGVYLLTKGTYKRFSIAKRQIGTPYGAEEEQVAGDDDAQFFKIITETSRRMTGRVDDAAM